MHRSAAPSSAASSPPRSRRSSSCRSPIRCCGGVRPICTSSTNASPPRRAAKRRPVRPMSDQRRPGGGALYVIGLVLVVAMGGAGFYIWHEKQAGLAQAQEIQLAEIERGPRVEVIAAEAGPRMREVTLLGDAKPFQSVTLYAKIVGYLKVMAVDKGDKVKAGQVIAEIDSAETDHQYSSAVADLDNKRRLAARAKELVGRQITSPQAAEAAETNEQMAAARVAELATLKSYELLRAPFAGTVTARFVDPGALVQNAATNQTASQPLVTISDSSRLRIYAHLEQQDVPF